MVKEIVNRYLADVESTMQHTMAEKINDEPQFGVMARYAMGWVNENDEPYPRPTGKRLRPTLLLLCSEAAGNNWKDALPAAAAVEILHNFSLIHDDIQDKSEVRHGRPTVWTIWGVENAINAGDTMFALAYSALEDLSRHLPPSRVLKIWQIFNQTNLELTRGQHLDMRFETLETVSVEKYISMIKGKSAALLAACAQMGALIVTGDEPLAQHYYDFGLNIGIAFQIHDDILGIWGDPEVTGKSAATDIISRKKSLPVLYGLSQSEELAQIYQREEFGEADVEEAVALLDSLNARDYTREQEMFYHDKAMKALEAANPQGEAARLLHQFVDFLFEREH